MSRIVKIEDKKIIQYDNEIEIDFLDFFSFNIQLANKFKNLSTSELLYIYHDNMNKTFKEKNCKLFILNAYSISRIGLETELVKELKQEVSNFFGFGNYDSRDLVKMKEMGYEITEPYNSYYQIISSNKYSSDYSFKRHNTGRNTFDRNGIDNGNVIVKINTNHLEKTKENVLKAIKIFMETRSKLRSTTEIKVMRDGCFGTIKSDVWNSLLVELEEDNLIYVKRTPKGSIRSIHLKDDNKTNNEEIMLKLESQGKLKKVSSDYQDTKNSYCYELYKFNIFPHLKTFLILEEDRFFFKVEYFSMKYGKNIMQDMGVWQDFKNALNTKFDNKISVIEDFLNIEITPDNKSLTPLKYLEGYSGEAAFSSKTFKINFK